MLPENMAKSDSLIGEWLKLGNVDFKSFDSNSYKINAKQYESPNYYFSSDANPDLLSEIIENDFYCSACRGVKAAVYPKMLYGSSYNYKDGVLKRIIRKLDHIIAVGDMPGSGRFGLSSWFKDVDDENSEDKIVTFWMSYLKTLIPVVTVNQRTMEKHNCKDPNEPDRIDKNLVFYGPSEDFKTPTISVCLNRVKAEAEKLQIPSDDLCIFVLLKGLAHAIMDPANDLKSKGGCFVYSYNKKNVRELNLDMKYCFALEESLANMIVLRYIKLYDKATGSEMLKNAKKFIASLSLSYRFGIRQLEAVETDEFWIKRINWRKWKRVKAGRMELVEEELDTWLRFVATGDDLYSISDFDKIFKV